jgi:hypothetical protein
MTAAGFAEFTDTAAESPQIRARYQIPRDSLVFGIAGALIWNPRVGYCYGMELVQAIRQVTRPGIAVLIVGDGSGLPHLKKAAGDAEGKTIFFTGRVPRQQQPAYFAEMDIGSLPQSLDRVGSFRYTTKISEYLACKLPVVSGQSPFAYDCGDDWIVRLPGDSPWDPRYIAALSELMATITPEGVANLRKLIPDALPIFDLPTQRTRVCNFINDLCERAAG